MTRTVHIYMYVISTYWPIVTHNKVGSLRSPKCTAFNLSTYEKIQVGVYDLATWSSMSKNYLTMANAMGDELRFSHKPMLMSKPQTLQFHGLHMGLINNQEMHA